MAGRNAQLRPIRAECSDPSHLIFLRRPLGRDARQGFRQALGAAPGPRLRLSPPRRASVRRLWIAEAGIHPGGAGPRQRVFRLERWGFQKMRTTWYLRGTPALNPIAGALCGLIAASCASAAPALPINSVAFGSENFDLGRPVFVATPIGAAVEGRACRRGLSTILSPEHVRLEDISSNGSTRNVADAYLPLLSVKFTERCEHYRASVRWRPLLGDTVRVCFERRRQCPDVGVPTSIRR